MPRIRHRKRLRRKEAHALIQGIEDSLGIRLTDPDTPMETAEADGWNVIIVNGKVLALMVRDTPFLTVRGLLVHRTEKRFVTVDMGAVRFVANGADIMSPGIVDADPGIRTGDVVWVRDVKNKQPLAIGEALLTGAEMLARNSGKAVKSLHYVGDKIWKLDEE